MMVPKVTLITGITHGSASDVTQEQLKRHANAELIQEVCPDLSAEDWEYLISGITQNEWQKFAACQECEV